MGRPKTNKLDPARLLLAVYDQTFGQQAKIDVKLAALGDSDYGDGRFDRYQELHRERRRCEWCAYSMFRLIDPSLTDGERRAWNRVAAELERQKLIEVDGRRCRLSPKGKKAAAGTDCQ